AAHAGRVVGRRNPHQAPANSWTPIEAERRVTVFTDSLQREELRLPTQRANSVIAPCTGRGW
ncbi:MAG TPA: hypothetical protein VIE46_05705, partial [Gemmatimonadales bacterium]